MAYVRWQIGIPLNSNFSFERDSNRDGIADGWTGATVNSGLFEEKEYPHCQRFDNHLVSSSTFNCVSGRNKCVFAYRFLLDSSYAFTFRIRKVGGEIVYEHEYLYADTNWHYVEIDFLGTGLMYFQMNTGTSSVGFENMAVFDMEETEKLNENPQAFEYDRDVKKDDVETINDELFIIEPILGKYNYSNMTFIFSYHDKRELAYIKSLLGEKMLIRTHENLLIACRLKALEKSYYDGELGDCQTFTVKGTLEAI